MNIWRAGWWRGQDVASSELLERAMFADQQIEAETEIEGGESYPYVDEEHGERELAAAAQHPGCEAHLFCVCFHFVDEEHDD